jgi:FkbM family methyltransferase
MKKIIKEIMRNCGLEVRNYKLSDEAVLKRFVDLVNVELMLDIGANTGQSRDLMRKIGYKGRIISFEPLMSAHGILVSKSRDDSAWEIAPRMAIGDSTGECVLNISQNMASSSLLNMLPAHVNAAPESVYVDRETVSCATLDSVWNKLITTESNNILLKIDVQGLEDKVLRGCTLNIKHIKGIQIELSVVPLYKGQKIFLEMLHIIDDLGFDLFALLPGFTEKETGRALQFDGLFIRK